MPEKIFTIPINEAFDQKGGCPFCSLRDALEEQTLEAALGAAMMEPSVRIEMNQEGFCHTHLESMYRRKNKLALGLILESHLDSLTGLLDQPASGGKKGLFSKKTESEDSGEALLQQSKSCYVCRRIRSTELRYCSNAAWLWESDPAFREKLKAQDYFCVSHSAMLLKIAKNELKSADYGNLYDALTGLLRQRLQELRQDVTGFTVSFDHRNSDKPLTDNQRSSLERSVKVLR